MAQGISPTLQYFLLGSPLRWSWWATLHLWKQFYSITNKISFQSLTTLWITSNLQFVWEEYSVKSRNLGGFFTVLCVFSVFPVPSTYFHSTSYSTVMVVPCESWARQHPLITSSSLCLMNMIYKTKTKIKKKVHIK